MERFKNLKLKKLLLNNIELKIFSLFLSVIIWYFVIGQDVSESILYIPIEYRDLPSSLVMIGEYYNVFEITIKGPSAFVKRITPQDIKVVLDLSQAEEGVKSYYQKDLLIDVPFGVTVTKVYPPAIKIEFGKLVRKEVPVSLNLVGNCRYGLKIASYVIEPKTVLVEGIQNAVDKLKYIKTDPINISDLAEDKDLTVSLSSEIYGVHLVSYTSVKVHLDVEEIEIEKILRKVKIEVENKERVITYIPNKVDITIKGPMRLMDNLNFDAFHPYLDISGYSKGIYSVPVKINYPDELKNYIKIVSIMPSEVKLRIK